MLSRQIFGLAEVTRKILKRRNLAGVGQVVWTVWSHSGCRGSYAPATGLIDSRAARGSVATHDRLGARANPPADLNPALFDYVAEDEAMAA